MSGGSGFTLTDEVGNSITVQFSTRDCMKEIIRSESITSGGLLRSQIAGSRVLIVERNVRMTETDYGNLMDFITRSTSLYRYYQATDRPAYIPAANWPLSVNIRRITKNYQAQSGTGGGIIYVFDIEMASVELFA